MRSYQNRRGEEEQKRKKVSVKILRLSKIVLPKNKHGLDTNTKRVFSLVWKKKSSSKLCKNIVGCISQCEWAHREINDYIETMRVVSSRVREELKKVLRWKCKIQRNIFTNCRSDRSRKAFASSHVRIPKTKRKVEQTVKDIRKNCCFSQKCSKILKNSKNRSIVW